jgi:MFS family permease
MVFFNNIKCSAKQEPNQKKDDSRSFFLTLINGIFASVGFRFIDSNMVLTAFTKQLTKSNIMVGLVSSTMIAGSVWPQLITSNLVEHRERKMPFYVYGSSVRLASWLLAAILTFLIGDKNNSLLFLCFYIFYFLSCSSLGVSNLPFNDIVAKAIPPNRLARLFGFRQFMGEALGIGVGITIRFVFGEKSYLAFPYNYAFIFLLSFVTMAISCVAFIMVHEPIQPVLAERIPFWQHLKMGPEFLKNDRNYRNFLKYRIASSFGAMSMPFYVPYALDKMQIHASMIGTFTAIGAVSALLSNAVWGYIGEKKGSRYLMITASTIAFFPPIIAFCVHFFPASMQIGAFLTVFAVNQVFISGANIAYMTYTLNMAPSISRPTYLGFMNTLMFPMSFVPLLAGALLKVMPYGYIFILSAIISTFTIYSATRLSEVEGKKKAKQ